MRRRAAAVIFLIAFSAGQTAPSAALESYARAEQQECGFCHVAPRGGGPRNVTGLYYQATSSLPGETPPEEVQAVVDAWLADIVRTPPTIRWSYASPSELPDRPAPTYAQAPDLEVLRRMSLDLRGTVPTEGDVREVAARTKTLDQKLEEYLAGGDFERTFRLYHMDLVRPRTGIHPHPPALRVIEPIERDGRRVWSALEDERGDGSCDPAQRRKVSPYWDRKQEIEVCRRTASEAPTVRQGGEVLRCDTREGQDSGRCGCGPHLAFCYRAGDEALVKKSMLQEMARLAQEIVQEERPYTEVLTADWSMWNGRLEHFYALLDGRLAALEDPDVYRPFHRVERGARHAGVLTTHAYQNFFYNGRRWAQRTYEAFLCHEVVPDFDLLDDHEDDPPVAYRSQPALAADINVNSGRSCAACHTQLDALARVNDRWDYFGQYRPVNSAGEIPNAAVFLGQRVLGVDGFARALAESEVFADCVVRQAWRHMLGSDFRSEEVRTRRSLVSGFQEDPNFKNLLRAIVRSREYRARGSLKLMERELYWRSMERITGARWRVGEGRGFDLFYDKVGGMDYRKIERRDRTPSQGHSLVQQKAAAETCDIAIDRDLGREPDDRTMLDLVADPHAQPDDRELSRVLEAWYRRIHARTPEWIDPADRQTLVALFRDVATTHSPVDGYKAACTAFFGSADFALY